MKKIQIIFLLLLTAAAVNFVSAQSITPSNNQPAKINAGDASTPVYTQVEQMPSFPGGDEKLAQFLKDNIQYPKEAKDNHIEGTVRVSFVIDETGKVTNVRLLKRMANGMDQEAIRVVNMMPNWIPGKQDGKPVAVQYMLPINFTLNDSKEK